MAIMNVDDENSRPSLSTIVAGGFCFVAVPACDAHERNSAAERTAGIIIFVMGSSFLDKIDLK
jgi:hypothetical protein